MIVTFLIVAAAGVLLWVFASGRKHHDAREPELVASYRMFVVGESFDNPDGTNRQQLVAACKTGDPITLQHQPDNPYDSNAIAVLNADGRQLGWIPKSQNKDVLKGLRIAKRTEVSVLEVQGGTDDAPNVGLILRIDGYV